jgi:hypothetical protein
MSYTLEIWSRPFPDDDDAAWQMHNKLLAEQEAAFDPANPFELPSPKMAELHKRLTARFPCICDDENGPWSDGPLINDFGQDTATVGIVYSRVGEVVPFVIETATGMGMHVFDGQDEVVHRPVGFVAAVPKTRRPRGSRPWWRFWR